VLFVLKEFPGHFGNIARYLAEHAGLECTFSTSFAKKTLDNLDKPP
jgi:hypothetical protein